MLRTARSERHEIGPFYVRFTVSHRSDAADFNTASVT
jgi:hypothetical protein